MGLIQILDLDAGMTGPKPISRSLSGRTDSTSVRVADDTPGAGGSRQIGG